ncbi:MAG TPA: class IV adenylate cyclase [Candidatus Vogelbacteria bacterium]|nr:class IV adenylate cyclase [Candidatus Vogelbacteria bacterium]
MNKEIEIKVILKNKKKVLLFLNKNAKKIEKKEQKDSYFILPDNNFFKENPVRRYLRVRSQEKSGSLDYHFCHLDENGKLLWTDEYKTRIEDSKMMIKIFENLGLVNYIEVNKKRLVYSYNGFQISIDEVKGLGTFIEVEFSTMEKLNKTKSKLIKDKCWTILSEIGADWIDAPNLGYPDLLIASQGNFVA